MYISEDAFYCYYYHLTKKDRKRKKKKIKIVAYAVKRNTQTTYMYVKSIFCRDKGYAYPVSRSQHHRAAHDFINE